MRDEKGKTEEQLKDKPSAVRRRIGELEELLSKREWLDEFFQMIITASPIGIYIVEDRKIKIVSLKFQEISGYTENELLDMNSLDIVFPEDREMVRENARKMLKGGNFSPYEFRIIARNGEIRWIAETVASFQYQGRRATLGNIMDVTELKEAQEELRQSEKRFRDLFNSVSDLIFTQDLEGRFTNVNKAMAEIFGYELEYFIGRTPAEFTKPELRHLFYTEYVERIKKQGYLEGVASYFAKDGRKIYIEYLNSLVRPEKGEPYITGIGRDVTERILAEREVKKLNKQILRAQKMEAVGTLAGGIAHDFNNLLQAIFGYTQILLMPKEENDPDIPKLKQIERAAQRASELTQQLLAFSRKVESKLRPVDLNQEVEQVRKLLERTIPKMIAIELHLEEGLKTINADPAQMEQVMMNLGVNARDAMPEGGKLVIETENVVLDEEYCQAHLGARPGKYVLLSISDTGSGMDKETVEHIFEPFFTTKEVGKGTGLGLAMAYGIVKSHGGYIMCYSEPGEGTTFKLYFPVMETAPKGHRVEAKKVEAMPKGGSETILLVDDEELLRDIGKQILDKFGYTVLLAPDGEAAIALYRERAGDISLVILDLIMPGMGGRQCLKKILKINPDGKVVIASGYSVNGRAKDAIESGARAFIKKPYELRQTLRVVREVLDEG